jgi:Gnt-I system high-affinity gluconate transporter
MVMLIIGGGGALKQVLIDSGISNYIVDILSGKDISPLVLAWLIAASLRIALGSATVAALTAAGIALPLIGQSDVNPELLVLATGAGSLTCSQVNDTGFWLFKEYFELSIVDTFKSWTLMETIVSVCGLAGCLILDMFV